MENSIKMDDLGGTTIFGNTHMHQIGFTVDCWQQNSINQFLEKNAFSTKTEHVKKPPGLSENLTSEKTPPSKFR